MKGDKSGEGSEKKGDEGKKSEGKNSEGKSGEKSDDKKGNDKKGKDNGEKSKDGEKTKEGEKGRPQILRGLGTARRGGGLHETFPVRKLPGGVGVERIFPLHTPTVDRIEVLTRGRVRRAKLYYLRVRVGKATRVAELKTERAAPAK